MCPRGKSWGGGELDILAVALVVADGEAGGGLGGAREVLLDLAHDGDTAGAARLDAESLILVLGSESRGRIGLKSRERYLVVDEAGMLKDTLAI